MKQTLQAMLLALVAIMMPIGAWAQESTAEAKWGTSAQSLTNEGTLADAIAAAYRYDEEIGSYIATDVAYIQLQSDVVASGGGPVISGGTFTLDLNGHSLTSDSYTLDIRGEGTSVTLVDYSEGAAGKVVCTETDATSIVLMEGASLTIESGSYEAVHAAMKVASGGSATITGGTFTGGDEGLVIRNEGGTLSISGGSFGGTNISSSVDVGIFSVSTTITGGTFAEGREGTIIYSGGKLDLTGYPTTATEGTTPLTDISVLSYVTITVDAETLALPTGYCFYNGEQAVTVLADGAKYTIGAEPDTKYTVTYAANGGSGTMPEEISYGGDYLLPECTFTAPEGKMFKAWQVEGTEYQPGEIITVNANTTVTAVWRDYVPQIILELRDLYTDGWNDAAITVKKDGEEIGTATITTGSTGFTGYTATFRYDYDDTSEYTFYWTKGTYDNECSFVIKVEDDEVLTVTTEDCADYEDGQLIHTIGAEPEESTAEAKWGTSAQSLTNEGTLAEAIAAAYRYDEEAGSYIATDIAYIQLQSDVTTDYSHSIYGGTFTLDLNGQALTKDGYTLDIRNEGTSVTLVDNSEEAAGKVISTDDGAAAIAVAFGANLTIESGSYEAADMAVSILPDCSVTITGGTFTGGEDWYTIKNEGGTLSISGGSFGGTDIRSSVYAGSTSVSTTITGGTFAEGYEGTIEYEGGKLDLTGYPTTAAEGTTPLTDISVFSWAAVAVGTETIALPTGYYFYDSNEQAVTALEVDAKYTIGAEPEESAAEAKWGTSAQSLTNEGTLADAIAAAYRYDSETGSYIATDIAYIQLQSDVTTDNSHIIYGGTFTLDLNGQTLTKDAYTLTIWNEGTSVTLADYSEEAAGKVISTGNGVSAVLLSDGANLVVTSGSYEAASIAVIVQSGSSATITGGTFTGGIEQCTIDNQGGTLSISGGTFGGTGIWSSVRAGSSSVSTTITGGTFAEGGDGTIVYEGGKLDLTGYPTTAVEGTMPLTDISVFSWAAVAVGTETIALPTGYYFYDSNEQAVTALEVDAKYTIGAEPTSIDNGQLTIDNEASGAVYDLQGRRVEKAVKGVYIVNGRKVVIK